MYPVFESIKIIDGQLQLLDYHKARMQRSAFFLWGQNNNYNQLEDAIGNLPPKGIHKCKVLYHKNKFQVDITPYTKRTINRLIAIKQDDISYNLKYTERSIFTKYQENLDPTDDVVFIKNEKITDTTYSNIALWNGEEWHTPKQPLLQGTKRAFLLDNKLIKEVELYIDMLPFYEKITLINAMLDLDDIVIEKENLLLIN